MRARRSAKLAEYLATYAILEHIGIHPTALLEKRDAAVGVGVYVRDACDAGTTLLAVPSRRFCANSVLSKVGLRCAFHSPAKRGEDHSDAAALTGAMGTRRSTARGVVAHLTGSAQWAELAWRLALEQQRSVSPLWGWLQSLPSADDLKDLSDAAERQCRVQHTMLLPYYQKGKRCIEEETAAAYSELRSENLLPSYATFRWAVEVLLSRALLLPVAWPTDTAGAREAAVTESAAATPSTGSETGSRVASRDGAEEEEEAAVELGVVPFVDLVNAPDSSGRVANAQLEVAASVEELPAFFRDDVAAAALAQGRDGLAELEALLSTHYFLCVTLVEPLRASEEVILEWQTPALTTGVLRGDEDQLLSRLLKYKF